MPTSLNKYLDPAALDETVVNIRELIEGLEEEMQDLPYARPDGLYPDMTVGSVIGADETAQWAQRESTGTGSATVRSVQGAAVAWNSYFGTPESWLISSGVTLTDHGDYFTLEFSAEATGTYVGIRNYAPVKLQTGHKYLTRASVRNNTTEKIVGVVGGGSQSANVGLSLLAEATSGSEWVSMSAIRTPSAGYENNYISPQICAFNARSGSIDITKDLLCIDLTQMFGSGNEPTTVAEFEAMYPASYYPYSAPTLKPVQIAGISSTDAQGSELNSVEWTAQTLRAAGSVADMLYSDHVDVRVGVVDLGTLNWSSSSNYFYAPIQDKRVGTAAGAENHIACAALSVSPTVVSSGNLADNSISEGYGANSGVVFVKASAYTTAADFKAAMNGAILFYELATPTTTPISPALPMTYRVQAGGSESIIIPDGEISAAPVLTVAEPVNAGDEFARIWAAIESLGYTRNTAQLSRPVSLTDIGSIDEVQKDTTEIDTVKEVTE